MSTLVLLMVASIVLSNSLKEEDRLEWAESPNDTFTVASTYKATCLLEIEISWRG